MSTFYYTAETPRGTFGGEVYLLNRADARKYARDYSLMDSGKREITIREYDNEDRVIWACCYSNGKENY